MRFPRPVLIPLIILAALYAPGVMAQLAVTTTVLPDGPQYGAYRQTLLASGGTPPYLWRLASGTLPAGLFLDPTGVISGTPLQAGAVSPVFAVDDALSATASQALPFSINAGLTLVNTDLADGVLNAFYGNQKLLAAGGTSPYSFSVTGGALPPGINLAANGLFSGTPTAAGDYSATFTVTDAAPATALAVLTIRVIAAPDIPAWNSRTLFGGRVRTVPSPAYTTDQTRSR